MIIFGSRTNLVIARSGRVVTCEVCGHAGECGRVFAWKHGHVFWIPLFNWERRCQDVCGNCRNPTTELRDYFTKYETDLVQPKTHRFGWIPVALIAGIAVYLNSPMAGG